MSMALDHVKPELMFVGTEFGLFCTLDGGIKWIPLRGGMPTIAVRDLEIQRRENDLVLASFGRGFFMASISFRLPITASWRDIA